MSPAPVVMLTNALAPDKLGGLERYVRELAAAVVALGRDVTVLTKRIDADHPPEELGEDGVRIVRHSVPSKRNPAFAVLYPYAVGRAVSSWLARAPEAVLHGHYPITTLPLAFRSRPYIYTLHAPVYKEMLFERQDSYLLPTFIQRRAVAALRAAERRVVNKAHSIVTLSEFMASEVRELSEQASRITTVIAGGIDTDYFAPIPTDREFGTEQSGPQLFTARRFTARTGVEQLVDAMQVITRKHPGAHLAIAGDGGLRRQIERRISELNLESSITLLGRIGDGELLRRYRTADLTIIPTQGLEGFGLTTAESMACGTPALVTPAGANAELVRDIDSRLLTNGISPADIAEGVLGLLDDPQILPSLRKAVRRHAETNWSWSAIARQYCNLYDRMAFD